MNEPCVKLSVNCWLLPADVIDEILESADFINRIVIVCEDEYDVYLEEGSDIDASKKRISELFEKVGFIPSMHFQIF